jgi:hypothetical protein
LNTKRFNQPKGVNDGKEKSKEKENGKEKNQKEKS